MESTQTDPAQSNYLQADGPITPTENVTATTSETVSAQLAAPQQQGVSYHMFQKPHQYRKDSKGNFVLRGRFKTKKHRGAAKGAFGKPRIPNESPISRALRDIQLPTE